MPHRQSWEIAGNAPIAALGAGVEPRQLIESFPRNLREAVERLAAASLEQNDFDAATGQFVGERAAAELLIR